MVGFFNVTNSFSLAAIQALQTEADFIYLGIEEVIYGAVADARGDIGGGVTYTDIITSGDFTVTTYNQLANAVSNATTGQTIYIPEGTTINFDAESAITINTDGLTIASNRGNNNSSGALLARTTLVHNSYIFNVNADNVRITGLDISGGWETTTSSGGVTMTGVYVVGDDCEVDNCEVHGWTVSGVNIRTIGTTANIHHNNFHHNTQDGLGYGVMINAGYPVISYNLFDYNRHAVAGGGQTTNNYEIHNNIFGLHTVQVIDMHGYPSDGGVAGSELIIHHNTFYYFAGMSGGMVNVRGVPATGLYIYNNHFGKDTPRPIPNTLDDMHSYGEPIWYNYDDAKIHVYDNRYSGDL